MSPLDGEAMPRPKAAQLARGQRRYRRKVASPKQWQAIIAAKLGPCRVCLDTASNGRLFGHIQFHHIVTRQDGGDDVADNIVPLCLDCHWHITVRNWPESEKLLASLTNAEYAYMVERGGERYAERAYGLRYER